MGGREPRRGGRRGKVTLGNMASSEPERKRRASGAAENEEEDEEDGERWVGPLPGEAAQTKKRRGNGRCPGRSCGTVACGAGTVRPLRTRAARRCFFEPALLKPLAEELTLLRHCPGFEGRHRVASTGRDLKAHPVALLCRGQGCPPPAQAAQSPIPPDFEHLQGWGTHSSLSSCASASSPSE